MCGLLECRCEEELLSSALQLRALLTSPPPPALRSAVGLGLLLPLLWEAVISSKAFAAHQRQRHAAGLAPERGVQVRGRWDGDGRLQYPVVGGIESSYQPPFPAGLDIHSSLGAVRQYRGRPHHAAAAVGLDPARCGLGLDHLPDRQLALRPARLVAGPLLATGRRIGDDMSRAPAAKSRRLLCTCRSSNFDPAVPIPSLHGCGLIGCLPAASFITPAHARAAGCVPGRRCAAPMFPLAPGYSGSLGDKLIPSDCHQDPQTDATGHVGYASCLLFYLAPSPAVLVAPLAFPPRSNCCQAFFTCLLRYLPSGTTSSTAMRHFEQASRAALDCLVHFQFALIRHPGSSLTPSCALVLCFCLSADAWRHLPRCIFCCFSPCPACFPFVTESCVSLAWRRRRGASRAAAKGRGSATTAVASHLALQWHTALMWGHARG